MAINLLSSKSYSPSLPLVRLFICYGRFIGVFDTVGALGLPTELRAGRKPERLFGFPDRKLGAHIQYAYQALAIDETRKDFVSNYSVSRS